MRGYRGIPKLYHQAYKDRQGRTCHTKTWYADIFHGTGKPKRIALGLDRAQALERLKALLPLRLNPGDLRLHDLFRLVEDAHKANGLRSTANLDSKLKRLRLQPNLPVEEITTAWMRSYAAAMLAEGYLPGSINGDLAVISRGFSLAHEDGLVATKPKVPRLAENNARKGFFERPDFESVLVLMPEHFRNFLRFCYLTGWRPKAEVLTRQWKHVDFSGGWIRLEPGETKNRDGREFPMFLDLRAVLEDQRRLCDEKERELGRLIPWVFFRPDGERLEGYHYEWDRARRAAGIPNRLVYDLRRTAVRNLERAGVPRSAAMAMVGHRTQAMYSRYAIADQSLLVHAGELLQTFSAEHPAHGQKTLKFGK